MPELTSFISANYRPDIIGSQLDKTHQAKFVLCDINPATLPTININAIAFGPKQDKVLLSLEHAISNADNILVFYYEDMHIKWSFVQTNNDCYLVYQQNANTHYKIITHCLYIRGCQVEQDDDHWLRLGEFYNFVDCWPGKVVCAPKNQHYNESKLYQLSHSLKESSKHTGISIGHSYVLKGNNAFALLAVDKSYIVKSLSGIRSIVVDEQTFQQWDEAAINNLPVLFQEKIAGSDLRIHVVNQTLYGKLSLTKNNIDYRYDSHFFSLQDMNNFDDELSQFCLAVANYEGNPLIGLDFIKTEHRYVILEANPSPGWSAYHECTGIDNNAFITALLTELKNA